MKLAIVLLILSLQVSANVRSQDKITLRLQGASLESILKSISKQTGYQYAISDQYKAVAKKIDIDVREASLGDVLEITFREQPFTYEIVNKIIVVKGKVERKVAEVVASAGPGEMIDVQGTVMDEVGRPLAGANVIVKETGRGTITNAQGVFVFSKVPVNSTLIFSFIGYAAEQMKVKEGASVKVFLKIAKNELDKVVIQAYGTTTQRLSTGNIATVTAEQIERHPVMNPLASLQGAVPGLVITQTSGYASAPFKAEIRGRSVINGNLPSEPLYIIDGVPLTILDFSGNYSSGSFGFLQNSFAGPATGQSPFFSVNPSDVESITVLKDADATAIYGSRGANGVILITTKNGKAGRTKFDLNLYHGISEVTGRYDMLNTSQYLEVRREAFKNDNIVMNASNAYDLVVWDTTRYTDWQKLLWGQLGHTTDMQLDFSGGDRLNTFRIGGGYHHETSILSYSGADQRASVQFNYTHASLNQRLHISLTSMYSYAHSDLIYLAGSVLTSPNSPPVFNSQGLLNFAGWLPVSYNLNPFGSLIQPYSSKTGFLNSQVKLQFEIIKGLSLAAQMGYSTFHNSQLRLTPIISQDPATNPFGSSQFGNNNGTNAIIEPQLEYKGFVGKGKLSAFLGGSIQGVSQDGNTIYGTGYVNDNLLRSIYNAPTTSASDISGQYNYAAIFGRINYDWFDRYILNLSVRRDGSSRFGPGKQFGNFGAVGAAWIFTEEKWFKNHLPLLSFGKLRGSYGITGSDEIGDYGYLTRWSSSTIPYGGTPSYIPLQHANPNLEWQTNYKLEAALDLSFFKNRFTFEIAWYRNRTSNQLVQTPLPALTGFTSVVNNFPATVQNMGLEMKLGSKIFDEKYFSWSADFNIGINQNKLIAFPGITKSPYASSLVVGQPLNIRKLLHFMGVDPQTGQYMYEDRNHDGQITNSYNNGNNDLYNKDMSVKFSGGFENNLQYKWLQLSLFFEFRKSELPRAIYTSIPGYIGNQSTRILNRWQKPGDIAKFARYTTQPQRSDNYFGSSDGVYTDGSYIRLRNMSLSFRVPEKWAKKLSIQGCTFYARGENLFVITKYDGIDPGAPGFGLMPPPKIFTGGLQLNF